MDDLGLGEPAFLVLGALFCSLILWWAFRYGKNWPPAEKIASEPARRWYRWAMLAFVLSMSAAMVLRAARHFDLVSEPVTTALGAVLAMPFFTGALPLIWYRIKHGM
jgi:hypothetical protein